MKSAPGSALELTDLVVLFGGDSGEREVSLTSGRAVVAALSEAADSMRVHPVEIATGGAWLVAGREYEPEAAVRALPADAVYFLGLHGSAGEDGTIQAFLEVCGRRYTGSGVAASALCMDKHLTRLALAHEGFCVAPAVLVRRRDWREDREGCLARAEAIAAAGLFVKPRHGGSSVGMELIEAAELLPPAIERILAAGEDALIEARVRGVECTSGVLGNRRDALRALPLVEIRPRASAFFDYREKYDEAGAEELCPPRSLDAAICMRVQALGLRAHAALGCDGYSRTDFIVPEGGGEPVVLEINTLPGLTPRSLVPQAAAAEGYDFRALCLEIVRLALARAR